MNRLIPDAMPAPAAEPASALIPGQKAHLQAQARELGVPTRGTKAEIWQRIAARQGENVGRRVRAPRQATEAPTAAEAVPAVDPFEEVLGRFQAFLGARS